MQNVKPPHRKDTNDMHLQEAEDQLLRVAEVVRAACLAAAQESYEETSMRGLCHG
jgi:hypothetical protein